MGKPATLPPPPPGVIGETTARVENQNESLESMRGEFNDVISAIDLMIDEIVGKMDFVDEEKDNEEVMLGNPPRAGALGMLNSRLDVTAGIYDGLLRSLAMLRAVHARVRAL